MTASSTSSRPLALPPRVPRRAGGVREVAHLAWPLVLAQMSQTTMHVVDSIFVGQLGAAQLGALGFAGIWLWTVFSVFSGSATGVQTFVSQAHGAGDEEACGGWAWQGLYALVPATALGLFVFAALAGPLFRSVGAPDSLREYALSYIAMRPLGFVGLAIWLVLAAFFRGLGDTRTPLIATLIANGVNIVLDYGLVLGRLGLPGWGIAGAAVATSIAEWVGAVALAIAFARPALVRRFGGRPVAPSGARIRRFLRTGAPIGGQWVLDMSAFAIFTTLVARMGEASMAATQAMIALLSLSFMQAIGIGLAATTLVGRYKGAGSLDAALRSLVSALKLAVALALGIAALFLLAPRALIGLFTRDADVLALAGPLLALGAAFQLVDALQIVVGGALRGAGDTRWPFFVQTLLAWALRLPLVWLFAFVWEAGVIGAWYAEFVFVLALAFALAWRFRSGAWTKIAI
ncbi:MATE family efflux transporter [Myxococcota bacterium]|nr:MATE family efflux transporter [Myxococcota bacterium]MCZ7620145.1 MATE family efflux transporter [Myxococcota bacterium]